MRDTSHCQEPIRLLTLPLFYLLAHASKNYATVKINTYSLKQVPHKCGKILPFLRPAVFGHFHSILLNYVMLNNGQDLDIMKHKQERSSVERSSVCY